MDGVVFFLCALTSLACSVLLLRAYRRSGARLLLWSGICFAFLAVNNSLLFIDLKLVPQIDLALIRSLPALAGVLVLIYGLIWEGE